MKHLDPKQITAETKVKTTSPKAPWIVAFLGVTLGLGALATAVFPTDSEDHVSAQERNARQEAFTRIHSFALTPVEDADVAAALDTMQLPPQARADLQTMLDKAKASVATAQATTAPRQLVRLASVTLWDTHHQDGDVVAVISGGYRREIVLTHAAQTVTFPVVGTGSVTFVGVRDGGGGITLGLRGPQNEMLLPIISEGQTLVLPAS